MIDKPNLVSIVIPIYNAEDYLTECIDSVINQNYKNIEIILINDGSTDNTKSIINKYIKKDKRIKSFNTFNNGVSAARNLGINKSTGDLIMFVDADDNVEKSIVATLLDNLIFYNADISICGIGSKNTYHQNKNLLIFEKDTAIKSLLYQKEIPNAVFAKLYKRDVINNIYFKRNIYYAEDLLFNFEVFIKSKTITFNNLNLYNHINRDYSAMSRPFREERMTGIKSTQLILNKINKYNDKLLMAARNRLFMEAAFVSIKVPNKNSELIGQYKICKDILSEQAKLVISDNESRLIYRIYALIAFINANLLMSILKNKYKTSGRMS